ncbi:MAG: methyltransferase domain-containing protein [Alphaproteobacteria bacterium]|nr:methyltransferase domain-containing protein [Alphaproteobacteria bacterium]
MTAADHYELAGLTRLKHPVEKAFDLALPWLLPVSERAQAAVGLRDRVVLDVGGWMPRRFTAQHLGARRWLSVSPDPADSRLTQSSRANRADYDPAHILAPPLPDFDAVPHGALLAATLESLPASFDGRIDVIFSINSFEHVLDFARFIRRCHDLLSPGGHVYAEFAPIWSGPDGHHNGAMTDPTGRLVRCPDWGHLLFRPPEIYAHFLRETDADTAARLVQRIYHEPDINRLLLEDYALYIRQTPFEVQRFAGTMERPVPAPVQERLLAQYPRARSFGFGGLEIVLRKAC